MNATAEQTEDLPYLTWDESEIIRNRAEELQEEDPELSDTDAFQEASTCYTLFESEWDFLVTDLTEKMREINPDSRWYCEGAGMGWRRRSGHKTFTADTGGKLLHALLPSGQCTFQIYIDGKGDEQTIRIVNSHHDAMGEVYEIRKGTEADDES